LVKNGIDTFDVELIWHDVIIWLGIKQTCSKYSSDRLDSSKQSTKPMDKILNSIG